MLQKPFKIVLTVILTIVFVTAAYLVGEPNVSNGFVHNAPMLFVSSVAIGTFLILGLAACLTILGWLAWGITHKLFK